MGRGRGRTAWAFGPAHTTAVTRAGALPGDAEAAIAHYHHLMAARSRERDRAIDALIDGIVRDEPPREGGGRHGDVYEHADDLHTLALLHAAHSDPERRALAPDLFVRAESHQEAHIGVLKDAIAHPRTRRAMRIWRRHGWNSTHGDEHRRLRAFEQARLDAIASDRRDDEARAESIAELLSAQGIDGIPATAVDHFVDSLLFNGDIAGLVAVWEAAHADGIIPSRRASPESRPPREWEMLRRIARARSVRGNAVRAWALGSGRLSEERFARISDPMAPTRTDDILREESASRLLLPRTSLREIQRAAWGMLADTEQAQRFGGPGTPPPGARRRMEQWQMVVDADGDAFAEWVAHLRAAEALRSLRISRTDGRLELWAESEFGRPEPTEMVVRLSLGAGDSPFLGSTRTFQRTVIARLKEHGLNADDLGPIDLPGPTRGGRASLRVWAGLRAVAGEPGVRACTRNARDILGPRECDHPGARWRCIEEEIPRFARLSCPCCLQPRAAVVPLHRVPADDPLWTDAAARIRIGGPGTLESEARWEAFTGHYARELAAYAALAGREPVMRSFEEWRREDGVVDMDPAAHAWRERRRTPAPAHPPIESQLHGPRRRPTA